MSLPLRFKTIIDEEADGDGLYGGGFGRKVDVPALAVDSGYSVPIGLENIKYLKILIIIEAI